MARIARKAAVLVFLISLLSCGSESLFMSLRNDSSDLQIKSLPDGQVVLTGEKIPLTLTARDAETRTDVELEAILTSPEGEVLWKDRVTSPILNEELMLELPDLPTGQYTLDLIVYSGAEQIQKKTTTFFIAREGYKIAGIKSFPPVLRSAAVVMLRAELEVPQQADPYLRWSWRDTVIAKGVVSAGFAEIFWTAPLDEGVYTIKLELFPNPPAGGQDYPFVSPNLMYTDIYVSAATAPLKGELGPAESYLSLTHLDATLKDLGSAAKKAAKPEGNPIGAPAIVALEEGFGYRLNGASGIELPWSVIPVSDGILRPFTISMGVSFDELGAGARILTVKSADGALALALLVGEAETPRALLEATGASPVEIPWTGPSLQTGLRYLISLSIIPHAKSLTSIWFLDGDQVSAQTVELTLPSLRPEGKTTIGGPGGFVGVVDEFGVYYKDEQGRPSPDPELYSRAREQDFEERLVLAEGFDGIFAPKGFTVGSRSEIDSGVLSLPPDSSLELPPLAPNAAQDVDFRFAISLSSARTAILQVLWEGSAEPALTATFTESDGALRFTEKAGATAFDLPASGGARSIPLPPPPAEGAQLIIRIANPKDAKSPLLVTQILAVAGQQ